MVFIYVLVGFSVVSLWLLILTFFLWRSSSHYNKITKGVTNKSLRSILEDILKEVDINKNDIQSLNSYYNKLQKEGFLHIQKVGLLRFNPFKDTGGDQSFVLALVDGNDTGIVISGLYARSGTRWYAKKIVSGKGVGYELSEEEKKAIKEAGVNS